MRATAAKGLGADRPASHSWRVRSRIGRPRRLNTSLASAWLTLFFARQALSRTTTGDSSFGIDCIRITAEGKRATISTGKRRGLRLKLPIPSSVRQPRIVGGIQRVPVSIDSASAAKSLFLRLFNRSGAGFPVASTIAVSIWSLLMRLK